MVQSISGGRKHAHTTQRRFLHQRHVQGAGGCTQGHLACLKKPYLRSGKRPPRPGGLIFAGLFLAVAVLLFSQLGAETKFSAKAWGTKKMFAQPGFWPGVGIIGMCVFGVLHAITAWTRRAGKDVFEAVQWLRALEYLAWFMGYVWAVPIIGYLPATLIFMGALAFRAGYRNGRMILAALATGLAIVVLFKSFRSVKIPGGAIYEYLPDAVRSIAILNF